MSKRKLPEPEEVERLYWHEGLTIARIAEIFSATKGAVRSYMQKHNIPRRPLHGKEGGAFRNRPSSMLGKHPFKYVGNGQVILGGLNPDFINVNSKKQIIEVFGDYWHRRSDLKYHQSEEGRRETYSQFGYTTMILWEHDLYAMGKEDIAKKLIQFESTVS